MIPAGVCIQPTYLDIRAHFTNKPFCCHSFLPIDIFVLKVFRLSIMGNMKAQFVFGSFCIFNIRCHYDGLLTVATGRSGSLRQGESLKAAPIYILDINNRSNVKKVTRSDKPTEIYQLTVQLPVLQSSLVSLRPFFFWFYGCIFTVLVQSHHSHHSRFQQQISDKSTVCYQHQTTERQS